MKFSMKATIIAALVTGSTFADVCHATPNLTWNNFNCRHYKPEGFVKAGYSRPLYPAKVSDNQCWYGYKNNIKYGDLELEFMKVPAHLQTGNIVLGFFNAVRKDFAGGAPEARLDHLDSKQITVHNHPGVIANFRTSQGDNLSKILCISTAAKATKNLCIWNGTGDDIGDENFIGLARATII